ncbi:MAG TPA: hypothetical protein VHV49_03595 [Pseudonocardiaceae bacterium]|nr:hypothetical protein [Pseudonocardiaceae bacterium]
MMNPVRTHALAREHVDDLRRMAAARSAPRMIRRRHRPQPRERVGWLLIEVGLRLTVAPR